jgi:putative spermidine/putrescine transport system permease protein
MVESGWVRVALRVMSGVTIAFIYLPLVVLAIYAFNSSRSQVWPPAGLSLRWFG